jgi:uncharacterized protein CbrC (UPF0167 family)
MELPHFKYHPDPIGTGSIIQSDTTCIVCGEVRGFIYTGPTFCEEELDDCICPWCIADGSAHEKFDAEFTDASTIGEYGDGTDVPEGVVEEVAYRTPGFSGWQQVYWCTHCGDASMFLGVVGRHELMERGREAIEAIKDDVCLDGKEWESFFDLLDKDSSPTAYLFQCRHCGAFCGYTDAA